MKKTPLLGLLASLGCSGEIPVMAIGLDARKEEVILGGAEILGVSVHFTDDDHGAIIVDIVEIVRLPDVKAYESYAYFWDRCRGVIRSVYHPEAFAHELGHVMGLGHVMEDENVMHPFAMGTYLTDEQQDDVDRRARQFSACLDY